MKIRRILSGLLAAGMFSCAAVTDCPLMGSAVVAEAAAAPSTPKNFTAESTDVGRVKLSWSAADGADGVAIYCSGEKTGKYSKVGTVKSGTTVARFKNLEEGSTRWYKLRAYRESDGKKTYSSYTAPVKVVVLSPNLKAIEKMKKKAPLFAYFIDTISGDYPLTFDMEMSIEGTAFGGTDGASARVKASIASKNKFAITIYENGKPGTQMFIKNKKIYVILDPSEKKMYREDVSDEMTEQFLDVIDNIFGADDTLPDISNSYVAVDSGKKKMNGTEYLYEKIYNRSNKNITIETYAEKETSETRYVVLKRDDSTLTYRLRTLKPELDESMFKVPEGYELVDD